MAVLERLCLHFSAITCRSSDSKGHEPTQGVVHACLHIIICKLQSFSKAVIGLANNFSCTYIYIHAHTFI